MDYDLSTAFRRIEDELISSMMRNLSRHRAEETAEGFQWSQWQTEQLAALSDYSKANSRKFSKRYFSTLNGKIGDALRDSYSSGETTQEAAILQAIQSGSSARQQTDTLGGSFFRTNERKLNALVKATTDDMAQAETAVLRRANDAYRKIIFDAQVYANTGAGTYEKAVDMATKDFLAAGIQCVEYSNGARHTLSDYADMAIKTASKRAYLQGEGDKRQEWGVSTVIVNKRGNACPKCARFCGKVFIDDVWSGGKRSDGNYPLLSAAIAQGLYHPRCKDSHSTWFPELHQDTTPYTKQEIAELEGKEQAEQRQQYAQRQAEKYRRMEKYSLDPDNQRKYGNLAGQWENRLQSAGEGGIVKAITLEDIELADKGGDISEDCKKAIADTLQSQMMKSGGFYYDAVKVVNIPQKAGGGLIVFRTNAVSSGGYAETVLEINKAAFAGRSKADVDTLFSIAKNTVCNTTEDGVLHEIGHAKTIYGRTFANYERIAEELSEVHKPGVSKLAESDGLECIAECEVLLSHGETLTEDLQSFYDTYTSGRG